MILWCFPAFINASVQWVLIYDIISPGGKSDDQLRAKALDHRLSAAGVDAPAYKKHTSETRRFSRRNPVCFLDSKNPIEFFTASPSAYPTKRALPSLPESLKEGKRCAILGVAEALIFSVVYGCVHHLWTGLRSGHSDACLGFCIAGCACGRLSLPFIIYHREKLQALFRHSSQKISSVRFRTRVGPPMAPAPIIPIATGGELRYTIFRRLRPLVRDKPEGLPSITPYDPQFL